MTYSEASKLQVEDSPVYFDWYRSHYSELSVNDVKTILRKLDETNPVQRRYDLSFIFDSLLRIQERLGTFNIVELGCHDGHLADQFALTTFGWHGYDLLNVVHRVKQRNKRFSFTELDQQIWTLPDIEFEDSQVFIASHALEHFSDKELPLLIEWMRRFRYIVVIVPLLAHGQNWQGYDGMHLLKMGYRRLGELLNMIWTPLTSQVGWDGSWDYFGIRKE